MLFIVASYVSDVKLESDEDLDEGPPPGWEKVLPYQTPPQSTVPMQTPSAVSSGDIFHLSSAPQSHSKVSFIHLGEFFQGDIAIIYNA